MVLLQELAKLAREADPRLASFASALSSQLARTDTAPRRLPVCDLVQQAGTHSSAGTRPTVDALIAATDDLHWQQSYTAEDGLAQDWLDAYGWVNIVSPQGLYLRDDMRISIGYWGAGQDYPDHSHAPEEIYLVLAGRALFRAEGRAPRQAGPGDTVHHAPGQRHGIAMDPGPLLAAAFWTGEELLAKSRLEVVA